ncbi:MAG: tripartite tricarboxylate transporter TctB family protein [Thiolinea sp.]
MADRIFAALGLLAILVYGWIAFTALKAPFQYDPLGPESWPRILSVVAALCALYVLWKPDVGNFRLQTATGIKVAVMLVLLVAYAFLFERLGFIPATALFAGFASLLLGARLLPAALFGIGTGVIGYLVGAMLLELNLPAGLLGKLF